MARYAVKIGEVHLISDKPISAEERKAMAEVLAKGYVNEMVLNNLIEIRTDEPTDG